MFNLKDTTKLRNRWMPNLLQIDRKIRMSNCFECYVQDGIDLLS